MVSGLLFVSVVADILVSLSKEYHYDVEVKYSYRLKNLRNEVYLSCHDIEKPGNSAFLRILLSAFYRKNQELKVHTCRLHGRDFVHFGKIKRGANERAVLL